MQLSDLILPVKLNSTRTKNVVTNDMIYIPSREDILNQNDFYERRYMSDYAKINARIANNQQTKMVDRNSIVNVWTCSGVDLKDEKKVFTFNVEDCSNYLGYSEKSEFKLQKPWQSDLRQGICPQIKMDINAFLAVRNKIFTTKNKEEFKIDKDFEIKSFTMGEYPNTVVDESQTLAFENLKCDGVLIPTGKFYLGCYTGNNKPVRHAEFVSKITNARYVRVSLDPRKESYWFEVEPLEWDILNWKDLPRSINPNGNGTAHTIDLVCASVVNAGIPFHPNKDINGHLWQNSAIRGYLNGYDMSDRNHIGNKRCATGFKYNFDQQNFIDEAFTETKEFIRDIDFKTKKQTKKIKVIVLNAQGLKKDQTTKTQDQII